MAIEYKDDFYLPELRGWIPKSDGWTLQTAEIFERTAREGLEYACDVAYDDGLQRLGTTKATTRGYDSCASSMRA
jgi:hypothetical protein